MHDSGLSVLLSRFDFAWITSLHILYPPLTIGLATMLFFAEWRWLRTGDDDWYRLTRFFEKIFIINFGAGVATGITMEMAFGILYGPFSQAAGPFFGQILGYETISAFMYEAGFLGLMVYGWGKVSRRMHLFATFNVALASALSAMWIVIANSWMQTPTGTVLRNGFFHLTDWFAAVLNPDAILAVPHMVVACFELALCFVAAVSAWYILKRRHVGLFQRSLRYTLLALVVVAPLQIYLGDGLGQVVAHAQPAALAAMEGHYHATKSNGSPNTGWHLLAWPNAKGDGTAWAVTIPHALSLLETHTWNGKVAGLDSFSRRDRPPMLIPFYAFRVMVGIGFAVFGLALWGLWLIIRGRMSPTEILRNRWFLRAAVFVGPLPYLAVWAGWWTREVGRQPWVVYGLMRTSQGVTHMGVAQEVFWLVGYMLFEIMVWTGTWYFFAKVIRKGPDTSSPVVPEGNQPIGHLDDAGSRHDEPPYVRPI